MTIVHRREPSRSSVVRTVVSTSTIHAVSWADRSRHRHYPHVQSWSTCHSSDVLRIWCAWATP